MAPANISPPSLYIPLPCPPTLRHTSHRSDHLPGSCSGNCRCRLQLIANSINKASCLFPGPTPCQLWRFVYMESNWVNRFDWAGEFSSVRYGWVPFRGSCLCCLSIGPLKANFDGLIYGRSAAKVLHNNRFGFFGPDRHMVVYRVCFMSFCIGYLLRNTMKQKNEKNTYIYFFYIFFNISCKSITKALEFIEFFDNKKILNDVRFA